MRSSVRTFGITALTGLAGLPRASSSGLRSTPRHWASTCWRELRLGGPSAGIGLGGAFIGGKHELGTCSLQLPTLVLDESHRIEEGTRTRTRTSRSRCRLFSYTLNTLTRISVSPSVPAPCYGSAVPPSLQDDSPTQARATNSPASFATTHWSVVLTAGDLASPDAQQALERLCRAYWYPLYAYVRRKDYSVHDAQDLTQEFFARLLTKHQVASADRRKGKFRSWLLGVMNHFLAHEWEKARAQKRGGGQAIFSLEEVDP
ncbi:MAG: hypothetical protein DME26_19245, partial [Verrucomicrobia bacterium]